MELISAKYVLPMDQDVIVDGAIVVDDGKILAVGDRTELLAQFPESELKSFDHHVLMPGLVNAHCHLDLTNYLGDDNNHLKWLVGMLAYERDTPLPALMAAVQRGISQVISTGTTCVGDMSNCEATFQIAQEMGLRTVIFASITGGPGSISQDHYESALAVAEKYLDQNESTIHTGLAPFAPYLLSRNLLRIISQHAKEMGIPLMIHAAESFPEMEFFFDSQGPIGTELFPAIGWGEELPPAFRKTPIQYLNDIGFLDASPTIVGGIQLSARDFALLARHLCRVVFCPRANREFGHGTFPWAKLHEHGVPVALGTDATQKPPDFNLWEEMRAVLDGNLANDKPSPKDLMTMATMGGARALGLDHLIGSLTVGKSADYTVVDAPTIADVHFLHDAMIRQTTPLHVRRVVVNGQILKTN